MSQLPIEMILRAPRHPSQTIRFCFHFALVLKSQTEAQRKERLSTHYQIFRRSNSKSSPDLSLPFTPSSGCYSQEGKSVWREIGQMMRWMVSCPYFLSGLFSSIMRELANISHDGPKWILLDGDIDPMWIESLNTVMDDNKVSRA